MAEVSPQEIFKRLKAVCVPLSQSSLLTPSSIPNVSKLLAALIITLRNNESQGNVLTASIISYTFFPLSTILQRNASSAIPDQVLEKLFIALGILCESWWWNCDMVVWEQIFMLCGGVIGGIEGKGKDRDDETKEAAARCLFALLRDRRGTSELLRFQATDGQAQTRLAEFQARARTDKFVPVLGQTLDSLLVTTMTRNPHLQRSSLDILDLLIRIYAPDDFIPSVLPGVVSGMTKVALGVSGSKGWANGDIVSGALSVMQTVVLKSIGDDACIKEGALHHIEDLEDLARQTEEPRAGTPGDTPRRYASLRTPSWLRGTSTQLHIAMNTLTPLVSHTTPSALSALTRFSAAVIRATPRTLSQTQPLLLSFLLSLSNSTYPTVSTEARDTLSDILTMPSETHSSLLNTLMRMTRDNLAALPRLIPAHADAKVEHAAGLIEAVCRLVTVGKSPPPAGLLSISAGIGKLLGPTGGIEKWGWSLLSALEFVEPTFTVSKNPAAQLMLESDPDASRLVPFPEVMFKNISSRSTREALERMFHALGRASGDSCLFSVEWFTNVGRNGTHSRSVVAIWCACRLLEGVADISLLSGTIGDSLHQKSRRLEKVARSLAKSIAELWDENGDVKGNPSIDDQLIEDDARLPIQHLQGVTAIPETLKILRPSLSKLSRSDSQPILHQAFCLQLLAVTAGILQARYSSLFIYTLYPVFHSLVSEVSHLSSTAFATLAFVTTVTSYASPANLLLSNFDYALDAVSRRLTRRWLDVDATKVLVVMVRLVGGDVVEKAGDIVEECFDRLDEYHGYEIIVEGLVEVLGEVIKVIETDVQANHSDEADESSQAPGRTGRINQLDDFFGWYQRRHAQHDDELDTTSYGPAPREAWGEDKAEGAEEADEEKAIAQEPDPNAEPPPTSVQALTKQIVSRSLFFLTHRSPIIRARVLVLLSSSVAVLPKPALLPSIHSAWPFILNRLSDSEPFVINAATSLIEALATHAGDFMFRRIWDDVWPRFRTMLANLDAADTTNALSRHGPGAVGTESIYTHSHRLYRSLLRTMTAAMNGVPPHDSSVWQVILAFRRFLHAGANEELQQFARGLYLAIGAHNNDAVWLALSSAADDVYPDMRFLREHKWDIGQNVALII